MNTDINVDKCNEIIKKCEELIHNPTIDLDISVKAIKRKMYFMGYRQALIDYNIVQ